jgi:hypothetical protein
MTAWRVISERAFPMNPSPCGDAMDGTQQLVEMEAIKRLKASYAYFVDTKDWDGWLALFAPDATFRWDEAVAAPGEDTPFKKFVGRDEIATVVELLKPTRTVHRIVAPMIDILSNTEARGLWAMEDIVDFGNQTIHGYGHYHETYRKISGTWKIASLHLTRQRLIHTQR